MSWPSPEEFREAIQFPKINLGDPALRNGAVQVDNWGLPVVSSGNFASVYKIRCGENNFAFRCFLSDDEQRAERYKALTDFITNDQLECTVHFEHLQNGVLVRGKWYPAIKMTWVDGVELDSFIHANSGKSAVLQELADQFAQMCFNLHEAGIAHGDLQHGNIIVTEDGLRLVDYDGMFVPALHGLNSSELGHRNYQHAARTKNHFGPYLDHFSGWLIHLSVSAIAQDPNLWRGLRDCLLFSYEDMIDPEHSMAFSVVEHHKNEFVRSCGRRIRHLLTMEPSEVPPLHKQFEVEELPPLLAPHKLQEELVKRAEQELAIPAPRAVHIYIPKGRKLDEGQHTSRLRVTSEVKYLGLPMGVSELRLLSVLRREGKSLQEAGRDTIRRIQWHRVNDDEMLTVGEFPWVPFFGFSYHDNEEVLVKVCGRIETKRGKDFAAWARRHMRGTWVTDGTSRFQFWEDSGLLTYELAAWKPRAVNPAWTFWDWFWNPAYIIQLSVKRKGRYKIPSLTWASQFDHMKDQFKLYMGLHQFCSNGSKARSAEPVYFAGCKLLAEFRFYVPATFDYGPHHLYQLRLDVSPGMREQLMQNLINLYGYPDANDFWGDGCANAWGPNNTSIKWDMDQLIVTYHPLEQLVDERSLLEKATAFFKPKSNQRRTTPQDELRSR